MSRELIDKEATARAIWKEAVEKQMDLQAMAACENIVRNMPAACEAVDKKAVMKLINTSRNVAVINAKGILKEIEALPAVGEEGAKE